MMKSLMALKGLLFTGLLLCSCALPQGNSRIINEIIYPQQVPASFEAMIICNPQNNHKDISYKWHCDNGTIKGTGDSVIWVAPSSTGKYDISVKAEDKNGNEEQHLLKVDVVKFGKTVVDTNTEIALRFPIWGDRNIFELQCMSPGTTLEIAAIKPWNIFSNYTYAWACNGGKLIAPGLKDGTADKIGWTSPGGSGNYTIKCVAVDKQGNISLGQVYVYVKNPHCCEIVAPGEVSE